MYKLNVAERLVTMDILPKAGTFIEMKVVQGIIKKLSLSNEDIISYDITQKDGRVTWNNKGDEPREFELDQTEVAIVIKSLRNLDETGGVTQETIPVYEKFLQV